MQDEILSKKTLEPPTTSLNYLSETCFKGTSQIQSQQTLKSNHIDFQAFSAVWAGTVIIIRSIWLDAFLAVVLSILSVQLILIPLLLPQKEKSSEINCFTGFLVASVVLLGQKTHESGK